MTIVRHALSGATLAWALLAALLLSPQAARPQQAGLEAERYFRVELAPEPVPRGGWAVEGYIYSTHNYRVGGVRLRVDVLDAAGQVESQALGWVHGDVPARGRAYFYVAVPKKGSAYRVTVLSFYTISRDAP